MAVREPYTLELNLTTVGLVRKLYLAANPTGYLSAFSQCYMMSEYY